MAKDPELLAHLEWLGYLQPVGLVVSPAALIDGQAHVDRNVADIQERFKLFAGEVPVGGNEPAPAVTNLRGLLCDVFGWRANDLLGSPGAEPVPESLSVVLTDYHETLRPTYAVREFVPPKPGEVAAGPPPWLMLIQVLPVGAPLDKEDAVDERHWKASPQARFERLLRETRVPIGLLVNGTHLRLVYAPQGESTGHLTFPVQAMTEVPGRSILAALHMLLRSERLFTLPEKQRLPAILAASRKYQNTVSTRLAGQVLAALYELLRGFQAADFQRKRELLRQVLDEDPDSVYAGLLTVLLRLVFLLYAEDRGLLSADPVYVNHYSVAGLFERLRGDAGRYPDTMDQRYGAWARLLALFRIVHDGAKHGGLDLPQRNGYLFDPDSYPFLEGRPPGSQRVRGQRLAVPMVPDGVVYRVLDNLLILDGERLSYRSLDVEQIGSVYEAMMGFRLEKAAGPSIGVKAAKPHGAPVTINLAALLALPAEQRGKWLKEQTDQSLTTAALGALKAAGTSEDAVAALDRKVAREATPNIVAAESMVLQPSDERRRSGSHYTPRSLTEPIVRKALEPVLRQLGEKPTPEQVLGLKVCDPAMGSGAFLVEACRQLGVALVKAYSDHERPLRVPPDETVELYAMREVAQRCLCGVDKNPLAVDLAKLSLWLATLAKDHPFTFLDHALRCGDSLVGLTRAQIVGFHWDYKAPAEFIRPVLLEKLTRAVQLREQIGKAGETVRDEELRKLLGQADAELADLRLVGDLVISAFFGANTAKARNARCTDLASGGRLWLLEGKGADEMQAIVAGLRAGARPITPFHWEIEFPEVFGRENPGFDCIVGNPPFAGKNTIIEGHAEGYLDWVKSLHHESHGNADVVAHFFRRAFTLLRSDGTFGLIATKTIAQGDTRSTGLRWICLNGGTIHAAKRRIVWPGEASRIISVVHVAKGQPAGPYHLDWTEKDDGREVPIITAYLFHDGGHENPATLKANANKSFQGSIVLGMGFTFDDTAKDGVATPIAEMHRLTEKDPRNAERIFPYIGGEEVNESPTHAHHRYVINFGEMTEGEARRWPDLMATVEAKVKPQRMKDNRESYRKYWWQYAEKRVDLVAALQTTPRVLVCARHQPHWCLTFMSPQSVFSEALVVITIPTYSAFSALHSRVHEVWARFFGSSMKDDLRYTPSDCFETFPFSADFQVHQQLEKAGREYYEFRADLMKRNNEGLTKTYNRFHDPNKQSLDIARLRELHAAMDRAVLDAYGWTDLQPTCDFLLDYVEEEENEGGGKAKKKPYRYRWPDDFRDEVLARLLALNKERAQQESLSGAAPAKKPKKKGGKGKQSGPSLPGMS
jgi:hypothetical protein